MSISLLFETMTLRLFNPLRKGPTLRGFDWLLRMSMRGTLWNSVPTDAGSALLKTLYQSVGMAHYCLALFPWSTRSTSVIIFSSSVFALSAQRWRKTLGERTRGSDERDTSTQELCLLGTPFRGAPPPGPGSVVMVIHLMSRQHFASVDAAGSEKA